MHLRLGCSSPPVGLLALLLEELGWLEFEKSDVMSLRGDMLL